MTRMLLTFQFVWDVCIILLTLSHVVLKFDFLLSCLLL
jgi:hypothetical protein